MKNKIVHGIILLVIIFVAAFLRLWQLGNVPPSLDWDEAALGYNAYSILKTGKDEYGTRFPLSLRSFDDYKPPLYMYLTVPSVALFGLQDWAVRLPSALAGILTVLGAYLFVQALFNEDQKSSQIKSRSTIKDGVALLSAFLLAISPWHIQFSRIAFEANIGLTINIWAVYLFLKGVKNKWMLVPSAAFFALGLYAYHSERVFLPLLLLILVVAFAKRIFSYGKFLVFPVIIGVVVLLPLLGVFMDKNTLMRLRGTSSLSDQTGLLARTVTKLEDDYARGDKIGALLDNRRFVWVKTIASGYLSHYSLRWWFISGDNSRHHAPSMGLLYLWELPFLLYGMYKISRKLTPIRFVLFGWFLIAPIAASPTTELPHAIRTLVFLPTFQIFSAVGIIECLTLVFEMGKKQKMKKLFVYSGLILYSFFIVFNIAYYLHMYFVHMNLEFSKFWQYGYKQAVKYAEEHKDTYKKIVVSTKLEQPHMFFLYYLKYNPVKYLKEGGTASGGFAEVRNKFDIYEFRPIHWESENKDGSTLYIGSPTEISTTPISTIYYLDGKEAMKIANR